MGKNNYNLFFVIIIAMMLIHGLFDEYFKIDNVTVLLLLMLILLPYFHLIRKIKYGNFEAEIGSDEIRKIEKGIEELPEKSEEDVIDSWKIDYLEELVENDPQLALAKVRIEIEKRLRSLEEIYLSKNKIFFHSGINGIIKRLKKNEIIKSSLATSLNDVISVANRAIHGESVSKKDVVKLVNISSRIIIELDDVVIDHALNSGKIKKIKEEEVEFYSNAQYKLTTIVPYVENPEERTYTLNQMELDAFLEGYNETAEFIINLEKSNNHSKGVNKNNGI